MRLTYDTLPRKHMEQAAGVATPPLRPPGAVPFRWEEAPGKPKLFFDLSAYTPPVGATPRPYLYVDSPHPLQEDGSLHGGRRRRRRRRVTTSGKKKKLCVSLSHLWGSIFSSMMPWRKAVHMPTEAPPSDATTVTKNRVFPSTNRTTLHALFIS